MIEMNGEEIFPALFAANKAAFPGICSSFSFCCERGCREALLFFNKKIKKMLGIICDL
jgi:hypothetical protein